jgi:16S rRNA (cytidine1402-2'-O)-methyltransferase
MGMFFGAKECDDLQPTAFVNKEQDSIDLKPLFQLISCFSTPRWHGQVVRQKPAKLRSPVRIWVPPMFFFIATPIGNLKDITFRAIEVLKEVDYILCEDTRVSKKLLHHYSIDKPLKRADANKEKALCNAIIHDLQEGKKIALISDAGTPLIQDPGALLMKSLIEANIPYTLIPGPSSPIMALVLAGFPPVPFHFFGFISKGKKGETELEKAMTYEGTLIFFESAHRIKSTLQIINRLAPERKMAIVREMTKLYEEVSRGYAHELLERDYRGELVLAIGPNESLPSLALDEQEIEKEYGFLIEKGVHPKSALQELAKKTGWSKKELYALLRYKL